MKLEVTHSKKIKYKNSILKNKLHLTGEGGSSVLEMISYSKKQKKTFVYLKNKNRLIGYAYVEHFTPNKFRPIPEGNLGVFLLPKYRGQGYAKLMLFALKQRLEKLGFSNEILRCSKKHKKLFGQVFEKNRLKLIF